MPVEDFDRLLQQLKAQYEKTREQAGMAGNWVPMEDAWRRIHQERKNQGLTLQQLCDRSGVAYATLSKLESGSLRIRLDIVQKVLQALGLRLWVG